MAAGDVANYTYELMEGQYEVFVTRERGTTVLITLRPEITLGE